MSFFGIPDHGKRSPLAKAVWKIELHRSSSLQQGILNLTITPPADTPIGEYNLCVTHRDEETLLAILMVLFNPWCPGRQIIYLGIAESVILSFKLSEGCSQSGLPKSNIPICLTAQASHLPCCQQIICNGGSHVVRLISIDIQLPTSLCWYVQVDLLLTEVM